VTGLDWYFAIMAGITTIAGIISILGAQSARKDKDVVVKIKREIDTGVRSGIKFSDKAEVEHIKKK